MTYFSLNISFSLRFFVSFNECLLAFFIYFAHSNWFTFPFGSFPTFLFAAFFMLGAIASFYVTYFVTGKYFFVLFDLNCTHVETFVLFANS